MIYEDPDPEFTDFIYSDKRLDALTMYVNPMYGALYHLWMKRDRAYNPVTGRNRAIWQRMWGDVFIALEQAMSNSNEVNL